MQSHAFYSFSDRNGYKTLDMLDTQKNFSLIIERVCYAMKRSLTSRAKYSIEHIEKERDL